MKKTMLVAVSVVCLLALSASAALVQSNGYHDGSQDFFPASATDLVNAGQSSLSGMNASVSVSGSLNCLNDGAIPGIDWGNSATWGAWYDGGTWDVTFSLNTSLPGTSLGYNVSGIHSIAGWNDTRAKQILGVSYRVVGSSDFTTLGSFENLAYTQVGEQCSQIALADSLPNGNIISGIDAIRFNIYPYTMMKEIDVFGGPVPEPVSLVLLAVGSLMLRRRK